MKTIILAIVFFVCSSAFAGPVVVDDHPAAGDDVALTSADVRFDPKDAKVVSLAANLLADDIQRVTGARPTVNAGGVAAVVVGTIGQSAEIDKMIADKKLDPTGVAGQWEAFGWQTVDHSLVIFGSDRRGTAFGVLELSKQIGVSPWYWWADVPAVKHAPLRASAGRTVVSSPGVKYRGIFLNDEDFGLRPWASKTFDPATGNLGPKTYAKLFELMLRLRMNYIWPAMHPGSAEFTTFPGNAECADDWAIVTGSSHCEPMLRNNVYWIKADGPWRYDVNQQKIDAYWQWSAANRGNFESVWTLGIRGIHDQSMEGPKDINARKTMVEQVVTNQRALIDQHVTKNTARWPSVSSRTRRCCPSTTPG